MPKPALAQQDGHNSNVTQGFYHLVPDGRTAGYTNTDPNISQCQLVLEEKIYLALTFDLNCRRLLFPTRLLHNYILRSDHQ